MTLFDRGGVCYAHGDYACPACMAERHRAEDAPARAARDRLEQATLQMAAALIASNRSLVPVNPDDLATMALKYAKAILEATK